MAKKAITGLQKMPSGIWKIDKIYRGERIQESTGTCDREEAEQYLIHLLEKMRLRKVYGVREVKTFSAAAAKYLVEHKDQPSFRITALYLNQLDDYIGHLPLTHIDDEALAPFIRDRKADLVLPDGKVKKGVSNRTVNIAIERAIRVLSLACRKWRDEERRPWLDSVPLLTKLEEKKASRKP